MALVTLQQLLDRSRQRADEENSSFVSTTELTSVINVYRLELVDKLVKAYGEEYFSQSATFATVSGSATYSLSTITTGTFYKMEGLDEAGGPTGWKEVRPYQFSDRNKLAIAQPSPYFDSTRSQFRYRIEAGVLRLKPTPSGIASMQLWWTPLQAALSLTTDTFDDINGWSEFIVVSAAIYCKDKSEQDTTILQDARARVEQRIADMAPNRDVGEPLMMPDSDVATLDPRRWRGLQ